MAKNKRIGVKNIKRHINRFLSSQFEGFKPNEKFIQTIDFDKFKFKNHIRHDKGFFMKDDDCNYIKVTNNIGTNIHPRNRQVLISSLFNDPDKPFEHLSSDITYLLLTGKKK